ncbi:MAG TPA: phage holin family protein [Chromobacteriaceae bacterium]|nr:phage holin family protein [Chromobacteriaceae bacterium]
MTDSVTHTPRPGTLRSFIGGVFSLLLTRAELLSLEAEEQKDRLLATLLLGGLALVCLLLGLMAMLLVIVLVTPASSRPLVLGLMASGLLGSGGLALLWLRWQLRRQASPFACTLSEVRKDWDALNGRH